MRKFSIVSVMLLLMAMAVSAQTKGNLTIKGSLFDFGSAEPLYPANVQVLALPDSTYVTGVSSEENGAFSISGLGAGSYVIRVSFIGYVTTEKNITLKANSKTTDLGKITLKADAQMLKEVAVTAAVSKVQMVNDTVVFNGDAYHLPEGATVEELVRRLPGVQIGSDGNITVNGKSISRILVNGKEFFNNDRSVALQNLTADMIQKVKAYDKQSDNARMTGIDDGEEETVLDLQVKKGMAQGWFGNITAGYGRPTKENEYDINNLYTVSANVNRFAEDRQMTILGSYGNTRGGGVGGFGGMRGMGSFGGGGGVSTSGQLGLNFARNIGEEVYSDSYKYEIGGSVNYSHNSSDNRSKTSSENFNYGMTTFSNSTSESLSTSDNINGQLRFEWNANEYTSLVFTPQVSYSRSNSSSKSQSASFDYDPYKFVSNPLVVLDFANYKDSTIQARQKLLDSKIESGEIADATMEMIDSLIDSRRNSQNSINKSESQTFSTSGNLQFVHRFNMNGRNISFRANYSYSDGSSKQFSRNDQYQQTMIPGATGQSLLNRYTDSPSPSLNLSGQVSYTEPIANKTYIQASYQVSFRRSNSDRSTYDLRDLIPGWGIDDYWDLGNVLDTLHRDEQLSQKSYYDNLDQTIQLQFRKQDDNYNFTIGASLLPQYSAMNYSYMNVKDTILDRTVFNWTPTVSFRYRWTRQEQINISYNGRSSQPSMTDLMDITDNSNPLSVSKGNPDLKPTFSNNFNISYSKYNPVNMFSFSANARFSNTLRNISQLSAVDEITRMSIRQPLNMDGFFSNWNSSLSLNLNGALPDQRFTFSSSTSGQFQHQKGWSATFKSNNPLFDIRKTIDSFSDIKESSTNTVTGSERLDASYRDEWVEVTLMGNVTYRHSTNNLLPDRNMDTWDFSYGPSASFLLPWHQARIITDLSMSSRRGYASAEMNTNELIWNAQVQFSFIKNKATLAIALYDILHQRSDVRRNMSSYSRTDTYTNNINSYFLVTFNYRLSMFGDRDARQSMRAAGRGMMMGGGAGMGGFGGGMGGGMPMGGGMGGGMPMGGGFGGGMF